MSFSSQKLFEIKNLDQYLDYKRNLFDEEEKQVAEYQRQIQKYKLEIQTLHGRDNQRKKQNLQKFISKLEKQVEQIGSGEKRKLFEIEIEPYYEMYKWHVKNTKTQNGSMFSKNKKVIIANEKKISQKKAKHKKKVIDLSALFEDDNENEKSIPLTTSEIPKQTKEAEVDHFHEAKRILAECLFRFEKVNPIVFFHSANQCPTCEIPMILSVDGSKITCTKCHHFHDYVEATTASTSYNDQVEVSNFFYQKMTHLNDVLKWYSDREIEEVGEDVVEQISGYWCRYFRENGVSDKAMNFVLSKLTISMIGEAINALGFNKKLNPIQIRSLITGVEAPKINLQQEETFRFMFQACEKPFKKHAPPERGNFLSYYYCLYKFSQILGWNHLLDFFPIVKGVSVLASHEDTFKKICKDLDWEFIPVESRHTSANTLDAKKLIILSKHKPV